MEKNEQMMTVIFEPVAQNTIVRPMAQAISLARGGEWVSYIDTADKKKKGVNEESLTFLNLRTEVNGRQEPINVDLVTLLAKYRPVRVLVLVNDVTVEVTSKTTVEQAMAQFHKKYAAQERMEKMRFLGRQRES